MNQPLSPSRLEFFNFARLKLPQYLKHKESIFDVGCGKLFFYDYLKDVGYKGSYLGIDIESMGTPAKTKFKSTKLTKQDFLKYKSKKKHDFCACLWVLEHIENDKQAIKKMSDSLIAGGILLLAVPSVWSMPFEFGRHGYHYYTYARLERETSKNRLTILESHNAGGLFSFLFMVLYNWPRFTILISSLPFYLIIKLFKPKTTWTIFSRQIISNSFYTYHKSKTGVKIHNIIATLVVNLDKYAKILPSSYIIIAQKNET